MYNLNKLECHTLIFLRINWLIVLSSSAKLEVVSEGRNLEKLTGKTSLAILSKLT